MKIRWKQPLYHEIHTLAWSLMRRTLEIAQHALTHNDNFGMLSSVLISIIEGNNNVLLLYHG
jgi:hypothetical protein